MPTNFQTTGDNPVDCARFGRLLDGLVTELIRDSRIIVEVKDLMDPVTTREEAIGLIQGSISAYEKHSGVVDVLDELKILAENSSSDENWRDVLGAITEGIFVKLLEKKYGVVPFQGLTAVVANSNGVEIASLEGKAMDAISWDTLNDKGEMHEVKKALRTKIRNSGFKRKLKVMERFKASTERHARVDLFIGVSTLFESQSIALSMVRSASVRVDCLGRDGIVIWLGKKYM